MTFRIQGNRYIPKIPTKKRRSIYMLGLYPRPVKKRASCIYMITTRYGRV